MMSRGTGGPGIAKWEAVPKHSKGKEEKTMRTRTSVRAGGMRLQNHNQVLARGLKVRTHVKAGGVSLPNHNQTLSGGLKVRTQVKAGKLGANHNLTTGR
jgi:hypothetical protein